jgi:hypothetical protein
MPKLYVVIGFCCRSGMCIDCRAGGDKSKRVLLPISAPSKDRQRLERVVRHWTEYEARIVEVSNGGSHAVQA